MRHIRFALVIAVIALGLFAATTARATFESGPIALASFAPLPEQATTAAGVTFVRLKPSQLARVRVSDIQALAVADRWEPFSGKHQHITVHLGAFADSKYLPSVPAYLVIFDGVIVPNLGPKSARPGHEDIEVIDALNGHALEGFSYR